ncbi:MAG: CBS domain-containing protein [Bacillota bacterium]
MEIITTHTNTDLDAIASMVAAQKLYPDAAIILPGKLSRNVEDLTSLHKDTLGLKTVKEIDLKEVKRVILVDTKNPRRIGKIAEILDKPEVEIHIYDHHPWAEGDVRGDVEVVEMIGSTATLLTELIREQDISLSPLEATVMALGIYGDTGSLVFTNTTPRDVAAVAFLLEQGVNLAVVGDFLGRPMTDEQKDLLKVLLNNAEIHVVNGIKVLVARAATGDYVVGLALLTHTISEIERPDAVFTVVEMEDRVHLVGRSSLNQLNIKNVMAEFGGSGHPAAGSASIKKTTVEQMAEKLLKLLEEHVRPPLCAADIMSSPVKTLAPATTIAEAGQIMLRYGHTGLPVVKGQKVTGVISRRDVEKATHHGLGHAPVKGFMTSNVITVPADTPVSEMQALMIENDIGRLPVVDGEQLVGIVSRTDILRTLHGKFQSRHRIVYDSQRGPKYFKNIGEVLRRTLAPSVYSILKEAGRIGASMGYQVYAAGGIVRDAMLGVENLDVDLVVEGDGIALAEALGNTHLARVKVHHKFGTAEILFPDDFNVDVATARVEFYEYPAAMPQVESSSLRQDLYRRDFSINAMAMALNEERFGDVVDYFGGQEDLHLGMVRVLHNLSFIEDPTRILRAIRFEQRYQMQIEPQTLKLLKEAVRQGVLNRVSNERIWHELKTILEEPEAGKMLARFDELKIWPLVFPGATYWEVQPVLKGLKKSIGILRSWGFKHSDVKWLPYFIASVHWAGRETTESICQRYSLNKRQTDKVLAALAGWREIMAQVWKDPKEVKSSQLASQVLALPREAYPLLLTVLDEEWMRKRLRQLLITIHENKPLVNGKFIKGLGYRPGPVFRDALDAVWRARLDGQVKSREEEETFVQDFLEQRNVERKLVTPSGKE